MYDFGADEEVPDDYVDPTRSPGADAVDIERAGIDINARIALAEELIKKAQEENAAIEAGKKME